MWSYENFPVFLKSFQVSFMHHSGKNRPLFGLRKSREILASKLRYLLKQNGEYQGLHGTFKAICPMKKSRKEAGQKLAELMRVLEQS